MHPLEWAIAIVCGPCICAWVCAEACCCPARLRRDRLYDPKGDFERRQKLAPRPALSRKQALTIPLPAALSEKRAATEKTPLIEQKTFDQFDSRLFKLPLELREQIYRYAIGDRVYHIIRKRQKLGHLRCKATPTRHCPVKYVIDRNGLSDERPGDTCWGSKTKDGIWRGEKRSSDPTDGDILPLLRACRRVYSESINILYSTNTFYFDDLDALRFFTLPLPKRRLDRITSLRLDWELKHLLYDDENAPMFEDSPQPRLWPPYDEATWEEVWRVIAAMKGLKKLIVTLSGYEWLWATDAHETKTLHPLRAVQGVDNFEVRVPWYGDYAHAADAPFIVVDPDGIKDEHSL